MPVRKPKPPEQEEPDEPETGEQGGDTAGDSGGDGGDGGASDGLREMVREIVAEFLAGRSDQSDSGEPQGRGRLIDEEREVTRRVEQELERVKERSEIEDLRETVKRIVEKPPVKHRRSTRVMWGAGDDD